MKIHTATVHYSATFPDRDYTWEQLTRDHIARGFREGGYHWYIRRNGTLIEGRPENVIGAHVGGHNSGNIGICWEGGLDHATGPNVGVWNITPEQEATLIHLLHNIQKRHPSCKNIVGHIDLAPSQCPGLPKGGVAQWWKEKGGKTRTLSETRTVRGGVAAGVGTAGAMVAEQAEQLAPLAGMSDVLKYAFVALTLAGIALTIYARKDDWDGGKR
jgi:hypothetical protein